MLVPFQVEFETFLFGVFWTKTKTNSSIFVRHRDYLQVVNEKSPVTREFSLCFTRIYEIFRSRVGS